MQSYRFGDFELDLDAQQLRARGEPVRLERRPLDLLTLLVTRHGRLVPREEIISALWPPGIIIDFDSGLNTLVRKVRNALGDSSDEPRFIETVPGRGYRFIAPIANAAPLDSALLHPVEKAPSTHLRRAALPVVLLLLLISAILVWQFRLFETEQTRIAVLPFDNLTGNEELAYLAAGIADDTNRALTRIDLPNLSVIGVVSSVSVAGSGVSLQETGRELDADFLVVGSLRSEASQILVSPRLIRVADGELMWSEPFPRALTGILGLQRELGIAIAEQIRQRLSPEVAAAVDLRQTRNPEAYALYLKGRVEWTQFRPDSIARATQFYRQAVDKDPGYALAWAGIAHALITSPVTAEANRQSVRPAARDALDQALKYGPDLAETQLALGSFYFFLDQNASLAEAAARQAVMFDSNSAMSHMFLGIVVSEEGKHIESRALLKRARELEPQFPLMWANSANVAVEAGEYLDAIEYATQAIAIDSEFWVGYLHLGNAHLRLGNYDAAVRAFLDAEKWAGGNATAASRRAYSLARLGRQNEARELLNELVTRSTEGYIPPYAIAIVHAGLGDNDSAIEWLERAFSENSSACFDLTDDQMFDALRTDPRFEVILDQCNMPQDSGVF